jgi:dTDP-4-dehydrorhamnose reductase
MTIWITGADGLLGSTLTSQVKCVTSSKVEADITSKDSLRTFVKKHPGIEYIINASAFSLVDLAETCRKEAFLVNALGPENLGVIASEIGAKVVHISTDYVFPGNLRRPLNEQDETGPLNYYGETKLEGERRLFAVSPSACVIRTSSLFGDGGKNFVAKLFQKFWKNEEIILTNDQYNSPTFVEDLSSVIFQMLDQSGLYHFANQGVATKFAFGSAICDHAKNQGIHVNRPIPVSSHMFPSCCQRPIYSVFDTSKIAKHLKSPIRTWEEALHSYLIQSYTKQKK